MAARLQKYNFIDNERVFRQDSASGGSRETRCDIGSNRIGKVKVMQQGFLRIPAALTRTGVFEYTRTDGSTVRELRHPDEVFKADSLASFAAAPVTDDHPGMVSPDNVGEVSIGMVSENVTHDERLVNSEIIVQRKDAIEGVQSGRLKEVSAGYTCAIDPTPGTFKGERYDQSQIDIICNHVALGQAGWGRAGPEVALRLDAAVSGIEIEPNLPPKKGEENPMKKIQIRVDGVTYEVEVAESLAPTLEAGLAKEAQERTDSKKALDKAEGALEAAKTETKEIQTKLDAATDPKALEAAVKTRTDCLEKAKKMAPDAEFDGLSIEDIRKKALEAKGHKRETMDSKGDAFVEGMFEAVKVEDADTDTDTGDGLPGVSLKGQQREDAGDVPDAEKSRQAMVKRNQDAWKPKELQN
jgi:hypothetical protein